MNVLERLSIKLLGSPEQRAVRCWLFHKWSKWEAYNAHYMHSFLAPPPGARFFKRRQRRQCDRCGLEQDIAVHRKGIS